MQSRSRKSQPLLLPCKWEEYDLVCDEGIEPVGSAFVQFVTPVSATVDLTMQGSKLECQRGHRRDTVGPSVIALTHRRGETALAGRSGAMTDARYFGQVPESWTPVPIPKSQVGSRSIRTCDLTTARSLLTMIAIRLLRSEARRKGSRGCRAKA